MAIIKTTQEILRIKKACQITDDIFSVVLIQDLKNMTEVELRDFILGQIKKRGLKKSFKPIVTSSKQAGNEIHPFSPTNKKLKGFVIMDFGVIYQKYMSDMTRTIYVGTPNKKEKYLYNKLLASQIGAMKISRIGEKCASIDAYVRKFLGNDAKYFIHTLGHGVGTRIHESPRIYYKKTKPVIKENMVITIEPGLYIKNKLGMRIEDTCLITKKGCIPLTKSPKGFIVVK